MMSRTMRVLALAAAMIACGGASASAHTSTAPQIACGSVTTQFRDFPSGTHQVTTYLSIDGAAAVALQGSFTGYSGQVQAGFTPPGDGLAHTYRAQVSWTADGGGRSSITTATLTCPASPVTPQAPVPTPPAATPPAPPASAPTLPAASCTPSTCPCTSCTSRRVYTFTTRATYRGHRVVGVARARARGHELTGAHADHRFGKVQRVHRGGRVRFRVTANFAGLVVPKGQLRTVSVWLRLDNDKTVRTVQFVRLCLPNDGNPNDSSAQDRARL